MSATMVVTDDQLETMDAKMMRETPLPMPLSSICSPHQVVSCAPAVKVRITTMAVKTPAAPAVYFKAPMLRTRK